MKQQCRDCASGGVFGVGDGKCSKCYGGGKVGTIADDIAGGKSSCPRCHGTGKCPTCGGSGLVSGSTVPARPPAEGRKAPPREAAGSSATPLEKEWYGICNGSDFIPKHIVDYYVAALSAEGSHAAIVVGLSDFTAHTCPKCGDEGQFKIHFLGRLDHPEPGCNWTGYMGTGSYIGFQIVKILHCGIRAGGSMKEDSDKEGESGGWINAIFGFLFVGMFRAALAVVLIPLHTIVALCQPKQAMSDRITRVPVLAVFALAVGIGGYELDQVSKAQIVNSQRSVMVPAPARQFSTSPGTRPVESAQPVASPQPAVPQDFPVVASPPITPQQSPVTPQPQPAQEIPPSQPSEAELRLAENRRSAKESYDQAINLGKSGSFDEELTYLERATQLDPEFADAYVEKGAIDGVKGRCEAAIQEFNRALGLNPRLARAYSNRGNCYWNLKNINQAIQDYTASLALDSTQAEVFATRGMAYSRVGNWAQAEADLREAIRLGSQNPSAYHNLGFTLFSEQRYLDAIQSFDQALALQPDLPLALRYRGLAKQAIGRTAEGLADLQRGHELDPQMQQR